MTVLKAVPAVTARSDRQCGNGDDTLVGGAGRDVFQGGAGDDVFGVSDTAATTALADDVRDFTDGDRIDLGPG